LSDTLTQTNQITLWLLAFLEIGICALMQIAYPIVACQVAGARAWLNNKLGCA